MATATAVVTAVTIAVVIAVAAFAVLVVAAVVIAVALLQTCNCSHRNHFYCNLSTAITATASLLLQELILQPLPPLPLDYD